jgi:copper homeostasis protein
MIVEVCSNSLESALNAERAGAERIELCSELAVGGITPSYGLLKAVRERVSIPVNVLIRPRGGDFTYSDNEFEVMKTNIALCKDLGFNGIVSGVLSKDFSLDEKRTEELIRVSENLQFTFHRAFDWVSDPFSTAERIQSMGVETILSSGQQQTALEGIDLLADLHTMLSGTQIMPGSGIHSVNAPQFKERGFKAIHLSGTKMEQKLSEAPSVSMNSSKMLSDRAIPITNFETILEVVRSVK